MVISYSLMGFEAFLKVPVIIIIRFGENVFGPIFVYQHVSILSVFHGLPYISSLLFIKTKKLQSMNYPKITF